MEAFGSDAELMALARGCLATEPAGRPRDASAVAGAVSAYLGGVQERLRAAERDRAVAEARAVEERRRRRLQVGLAASLLGLVIVGGAGAAWYLQQRHARLVRVDSLLQAAGSALDLAERSDGPASSVKEDEARLALGQAAEVSGGGVDAATTARLAALRDRFAQAARFRALLQALEPIRGRRAEHVDDRRADREYASAFRAFGLDESTLEPEAFGAALAGRPTSVEIAAALADWASARMNLDKDMDDRPRRRLVAAARVADPDRWRSELRTLIGRRSPEAREALARLAADDAVLERQPAESLSFLGGELTRAGERDLATRVLRGAWRRFPGDFWVNYWLGRSVMPDASEAAPMRAAEGARFCTAAVAARPGSASGALHPRCHAGDAGETRGGDGRVPRGHPPRAGPRGGPR